MQLRARPQQLKVLKPIKDPVSNRPIKRARRPLFESWSETSDDDSHETNTIDTKEWRGSDGQVLGVTLSYSGMTGVKIPTALFDEWKPDEWILLKRHFDYEYRMQLDLMRFLHRNTEKEEMTVHKNDALDNGGRHFIIESVSSAAHFLLTNSGQSDLALTCRGHDAIVLKRGLMLTGEDKDHTQYVCDLPRGMLKNWVYSEPYLSSSSSPEDIRKLAGSCALRGSALTRGDVLRFSGQNLAPKVLSYQVPEPFAALINTAALLLQRPC